jgi:anti-anti-sigma factor
MGLAMRDPVFTAMFAPDRIGAVVSISGELDLLSAYSLWSALDAVPRNQHVVLDCSGIRFVDSSGLHVILAQHEHRAAQGGSVAIRNPSPTMRRLLELTGASRLIEGRLAS